MARARLVSVLALLASTPALAVEGPVAVMPFKNANGTPRLDWLRLGIAETMITDLKRSGKVTVVERDQVDKALAELARQKTSGSDETSAARVGKLVGARTIVVGAFQEAERQVRISARFVAVESGVVVDAAVATGPIERIFALQDEVVDRLLGAPPARRPRRQAAPKTVQAYRLYAQSLQTGSDTEKVSWLKQSIAADPEFSYAVDDLAALEKRLASYEKVATAKLAERERLLLMRAGDGKVAPDERLRCARELVESLSAARAYHTLVTLAPRLLALKLAPELDELVSFRLFGAYDRLRRVDQAFEAGEKHLKTYPIGIHYRDVETRLRELAEARRKMNARRAEYASDLAEKRSGIVQNGVVPPDKKLEYDYAPCIAARWNSQFNELMLDGCSQFLQQHAGDRDPEAREYVLAARFFIVLALAERGDFDKARPLAEQVLADTHDWDEDLRKLMSEWPTD
jgi:TolB-like protein